MPRPLLFSGHKLTRRDFYDVVRGNRPVALAPNAHRAMARSPAPR